MPTEDAGQFVQMGCQLLHADLCTRSTDGRAMSTDNVDGPLHYHHHTARSITHFARSLRFLPNIRWIYQLRAVPFAAAADRSPTAVATASNPYQALHQQAKVS